MICNKTPRLILTQSPIMARLFPIASRGLPLCCRGWARCTLTFRSCSRSLAARSAPTRSLSGLRSTTGLTRSAGAVKLFRTGGGLWVTATLESIARYTCSRCLEEHAQPLKMVIDEEAQPADDIAEADGRAAQDRRWGARPHRGRPAILRDSRSDETDLPRGLQGHMPWVRRKSQ